MAKATQFILVVFKSQTTVDLRRSGVLPMLLRIDLSLSHVQAQEQERLNPSEILAEHIHRCHRLQIIWDFCGDFRHFVEGLRHLLALVLQSIQVCGKDERATDYISEDPSSIRIYEGDTPSLQSF